MGLRRSSAVRTELRCPLCFVLSMTVSLLAFAALATPAFAEERIESFTTTSSTAQAGGHPDLETSFTLQNPGEPEAAKNVIFNAPQGVFGNTNAITQCTADAFALDECPTAAQAGLITVNAHYEGNNSFLLGTAPVYDIAPQVGETARFAFIVPSLDIPIGIPVTVRTGEDYGLRFTVQDISQLTPLAHADLTFWGFPADESHNAQRFAKGSPGEPAGCVGLTDASCTLGLSAGIANKPLTDNPTTCTGGPLITRLEVQTYQDPQHLSTKESSYPEIEGCEDGTFNPVLEASPTTTETDSPSGLNIELRAPQAEGHAASPSELKSSVVAMPPGFTINPDAADGQSDCTQAQANFGSEGPAECPDQSKIGTFAIGSPTLNGPLTGSVYIGEPRPGEQYRLFMIASGFGMNIKLVGLVQTQPRNRSVGRDFRKPPSASLRNFSAAPLLRGTGADGDTHRLHDLHGQRRLLPLGCGSGRSDLDPGLRPRNGPQRQ